MKQSTSEQCFVSTTVYDEVEIEVSEILFDLHNLIRKSESRLRSRSRFGFTPLLWGSTRKRSNRGSILLNSRLNYSPSLSSSSSPSPSCLLRNSQVRECDIETENMKIEEATSPDTPLSFFPCESDDKRMIFHSSQKKISKTKRRHELIDTVETLTKRNDMLKVEVENVRNYYNQQKTYNLKLKAMKEGVMSILNGSKPMISLGQQQFGTSTVQPIILDHHNPLRLNQYPMGQMSLGCVTTKRCPLDIPDLNMTVEDTYITERRAQFAEARRKRRLIQINKASSFIRPHRK